jgi:hypothetical protein
MLMPVIVAPACTTLGTFLAAVTVSAVCMLPFHDLLLGFAAPSARAAIVILETSSTIIGI